MDRTDQSLIALRRILRSTELYTRDLASAAGLTPAQLRVLQIVSGKGGTATPKELSKQMGVSQATVTALVDKLVARGHVARERSDVDRRQTNVNITARGRAAVAEAPDALQQRYVKAFEALEGWEQMMLVAALERVAGMLDARDLDAARDATIDASDWFYEGAARKAVAAGTPVDRDALRDLYVEAHVEAAEFYDGIARQAWGRSPVHVLLLHETDIAAMWIDDLVRALRAKGWTIVSADEAFADPIAADAATYDTPFAQGTLTEQVAWQEGVPAPRWYRGNNTDLAQEWFDARVLARSADDED